VEHRAGRLLPGTALALAALLGAGVSGCLETSAQRRSNFRQRADEILPDNARVRAFGYGDCVELASNPSCARAVFELPLRDSARRARLVRSEAERHGWTVTHEDDAEGGWSLFLKRPGFTAFVVLWRSARYDQNCHVRRPPDECFITLNIEQD
jgi:hypothetical protein